MVYVLSIDRDRDRDRGTEKGQRNTDSDIGTWTRSATKCMTNISCKIAAIYVTPTSPNRERSRESMYC